MTATPDRQVADRQRRHNRQAATAGDRHTASRQDRQDRHLAVATPGGGDTATPPPRQTASDRQGGEVAVTHRIVATRDGDGAGAAGGGGRVAEWASGLRFVHQSPGSLLDRIDYARNGAYSIQVEGWWRHANIWFARLIAAPGMAFCYLIVWAFFTRLSRTLLALIVVPMALMLANKLPVTAWLIPDWADFTTAFSAGAGG